MSFYETLDKWRFESSFSTGGVGRGSVQDLLVRGTSPNGLIPAEGRLHHGEQSGSPTHNILSSDGLLGDRSSILLPSASQMFGPRGGQILVNHSMELPSLSATQSLTKEALIEKHGRMLRVMGEQLASISGGASANNSVQRLASRSGTVVLAEPEITLSADLQARMKRRSRSTRLTGGGAGGSLSASSSQSVRQSIPTEQQQQQQQQSQPQLPQPPSKPVRLIPTSPRVDASSSATSSIHLPAVMSKQPSPRKGGISPTRLGAGKPTSNNNNKDGLTSPHAKTTNSNGSNHKVVPSSTSTPSKRGKTTTATAAPSSSAGSEVVLLRHTFNGVTKILYDDGRVEQHGDGELNPLITGFSRGSSPARGGPLESSFLDKRAASKGSLGWNSVLHAHLPDSTLDDTCHTATGKDAMTIDSINDGGMGELLMESHGGSTRIPSPPMPTVSPSDDFDLRPLTHNTSAVEDSPRDGFVPQRINNRGGATVFAEFDERHAPFSTGPLQEQHSDSGDLGAPLGHSSVFLTQTQMEGHNNNWGRNTATPRGFKSLNSTVTSTTMVLGGGVSSRHPRLDDDSCDFGSFACSDILRRGNAATANPDRPPSTADGDDVGVDDDDESGTKASTSLHPHPGSERVLREQAPSLFSIPLPEIREDGSVGHPELLPCGWTVYQLFRRLLEREEGSMRSKLSGLDIMRFMWKSSAASELIITFVWYVITRCRKAWLERLLIDQYYRLEALYQELFTQARKERLPQVSYLEQLVSELLMVVPEWREVEAEAERLAEVQLRRKSSRFLNLNQARPASNHSARGESSDGRVETAPAKPRSAFLARRQSIRGSIHDDLYQCDLQGFLEERGCATILRTPDLLSTGTLPEYTDVQELASALRSFVSTIQENVDLITYEERCFQRLSILFGQIFLELSSSEKDLILESYGLVVVRLTNFCLLFCFPNDSHAGIFGSEFRADMHRLFQYWCSGLVVAHVMVKNWPVPKLLDHHDMEVRQKQEKMQRFMSHRYAEYLVPKDGTEWYVDMPEGMAFPGDVCGGDGGISNIMSSTQFGDGAEIIAAAATDGSAGSTPQRQHAPHLPTALATLPAVYSSGTTAPHRLSPMHPPGSLTNLAEFSITSPHASHSPGRAESTTPTLTSPHRRGKDGGAEPRTSMTTFSGGSPARDTSSGGPPTSNTTSITAYPAVKALSMLAAGHHRRSSVNMTVDDIRAEQLISEQLNATMSLPSRARSCSKVGADLIQMGAESVARSGGGGGETSAERLPWALFRSRSSVAVKSRNNNNYNRSEENSKSSPGPHSPLNRYRSGFSAAFQSSSRAGGGGIDANNESMALTSTMRAKKTQPLGSAVHESVDVDVVNSEYRLAAEFQRYTKHAGMLVNELDRQLTVQHQKQRRKDQITLRLAEQLRNLSDLQRITSGGGPNEWEEGGAGASPSPHHQQQQQQQNDVADGRERRSPSPPNLGSTRRAQFLPSIVTEKAPPSANNHVSLRRGGAGAGTVAGCRRSPIVVEKERRSSRSTSAVAPADPLTQTLAAPPSRGSTASPSLTARCTPGASPSPEVGSWPKAGSPGEKMMMMMSGDNSSGEVFPLLHVEHTTPSQSEHEHSSGISSMSRSQKNNNFSHGRSPPHPIIVEVNVAEQQQHPAHGDQQQQQSPPPIASPLTARFVESPPEHRWSPQPRSGCTSPQAQLATPTPDGVAPTPTPTPPTMMAEMMDVDAPGVLQKRSTPPPPPPTQAPSMLPTPARSVNRRPPSSARQVQQEREEERSRGLRRRARLATSAEVPARPTLVRVAQELKDSKMTLNGENATASSLVHPSARRPGVAGDGDGCTNNNNATKCGGEDDDDEMPKIDYKAAAATTSMARGGPENTAVGLMRRFVMGESVNQSLLMAYPLAVCEDSIQAYVADTVGMRYPNVPLLPTCAAAKHLRVMARRQQHQRRRSGHRSTSLSVGSFTRDAPGGATDAPNVAAPTAMVATTSSSSTPIPASTAVATTTTTTTTSPPPAKAHVPASPTHSSPRARDGRILSGESLTPGGGRRAAAVADMEILAPNRTLLPTASPFIKHYAKEVLGMDLDRDDHTTTSGANNTALVVATTPTTRAAMLEAPFAQTPLGSPPRDGISWSGAGANGSITSTPSSSHAHTTKSVFRGEGRPTRNKTHLLVIPPEEGLQRPLLYGELRKEAMQRERSLMDDLGTIAKRENISRMQYDRDRLRMTSLVDRTRSEFSTTRFQQQARRQLELAIAAKAQEDAAEGESTARVQGSGSG